MRKGSTLVEIMIVVAIVALLAAIAIPNLLRARIAGNETYAQATLRTISTGCEDYANLNNGAYPADIATLTGASPPYINEDYTAAARQGYNFACGTMGASGYSCTATPVTCGTTGNTTYTITTGGVLTSAACS